VVGGFGTFQNPSRIVVNLEIGIRKPTPVAH
jgi:hypothetical protein